MKNEIIAGTVVAIIASSITYLATSTETIISRVQIEKIASELSNDDAFMSVLLEDLSQDPRFKPKNGKDGLDGKDGKDGLSDIIPKGVVASFALSSCPENWAEYKPAYGRFIRGIDKSGNRIDPDGLRRVSEYQDDSFQNHTHSISNAKTAHHDPQVGAPHGYESGRYGNTITTTTNVNSGRVSTETRPKNVSLLYCVKN
jgi:hypothetical protein